MYFLEPFYLTLVCSFALAGMMTSFFSGFQCRNSTCRFVKKKLIKTGIAGEINKDKVGGVANG